MGSRSYADSDGTLDQLIESKISASMPDQPPSCAKDKNVEGNLPLKLTITNPSCLKRFRPLGVPGEVAAILLDQQEENTDIFCTRCEMSSPTPSVTEIFIMRTPEKESPQIQLVDAPVPPREISPEKFNCIRKINLGIKKSDFEGIHSIVDNHCPIPGASDPCASYKSEDSTTVPPIVVASTFLKGSTEEFALKTIQYFIEKGACPNICSTVTGYSAFHWAAVLGSVEGMRVLYEGKADVNIKCMKEEETPLHRACRFGKVESVQLLLSKFRADPYLVNREGFVALDGNVLATHVGSVNSRAAVLARENIQKCFFRERPDHRTLILHHSDCLGHRTIQGHQENPNRISAVLKYLLDTQNFESNELQFCNFFPRASFEMIQRAHSFEYVNFVYKLSQQFLCNTPRIEAFTPRVQQEVQRLSKNKIKPQSACDTNFSQGSLTASLRSAGSVCFAVDKVVMGENRNAFCVVRPPGHHAGWAGHVAQSASCGFCIFNSVAIGAMHCLATYETIQRIAIVDIDVHHGNGTEEIIKKINRPSNLFFASVHLFDENFYPGSGQSDEICYNVVNIPIAPMWKLRQTCESDGFLTGRHAFKSQFSQRLLPALRAFGPDLIIVSAGFDAAKHDIGNKREGNWNGDIGMDLTKEDYFWATSHLKSIANLVCKGRLVMVLEGGYGKPCQSVSESQHVLNRDDLSANSLACVRALVGKGTTGNVNLSVTSKRYSNHARLKKYMNVRSSSKVNTSPGNQLNTSPGNQRYTRQSKRPAVGKEDNDSSDSTNRKLNLEKKKEVKFDRSDARIGDEKFINQASRTLRKRS